MSEYTYMTDTNAAIFNRLLDADNEALIAELDRLEAMTSVRDEWYLYVGRDYAQIGQLDGTGITVSPDETSLEESRVFFGVQASVVVPRNPEAPLKGTRQLIATIREVSDPALGVGDIEKKRPIRVKQIDMLDALERERKVIFLREGHELENGLVIGIEPIIAYLDMLEKVGWTDEERVTEDYFRLAVGIHRGFQHVVDGSVQELHKPQP